MSPMSEDVLERNKSLCQYVEFIDSWVDAVKTWAMIWNLLTVCNNKKESSINLKRLPVCCSNCLQREDIDQLPSLGRNEFRRRADFCPCHKSILCLATFIIQTWWKEHLHSPQPKNRYPGDISLTCLNSGNNRGMCWLIVGSRIHL